MDLYDDVESLKLLLICHVLLLAEQNDNRELVYLYLSFLSDDAISCLLSSTKGLYCTVLHVQFFYLVFLITNLHIISLQCVR